MISVKLTQQAFWQHNVEGYLIPLKKDLVELGSESVLKYIEEHYYPHLKELLKKHQFEGDRGQAFTLTAKKNDSLIQFLFVGVGGMHGAWHQELEILRRALATGFQAAKRNALKDVVVALPAGSLYQVSDDELAKQMTLLAHMATYEFTTFKSDSKKKTPWTGTVWLFSAASTDAVEQGNIIGAAINQARHWADLPANHMTPAILAGEAERIAVKHGFKKTIFGRKEALELGMGGFCAVDAGSAQDGKFVVLEYKAKASDAPTIALCGKGVIFDTGGINLKPTSGISGMKFDMSGAAAVITVMDIIGQLKPAVNVVGLTPLVENMPSGTASRPDDVITCMNGKTVEIQNTDAEGRLILSDTLCYAEKFFNPTVMIDIATLTGAVQHGLGHFYTGVMTKDDELAQSLLAIGRKTGDRTWQLPMDDDFKGAIRSDVADIHNNGSSAYYAGTIVGATFLSNFVEKARWAHLDIAGTAHDVPAINYVGKGATGAGVRLLTEFVLNFQG
ncbi:leucyl aminopeptidase [Candidatus Dependentiae bacterium]|nr:leucyl aminopeptidase [Candidatus Dependentiae bacterium]